MMLWKNRITKSLFVNENALQFKAEHTVCEERELDCQHRMECRTCKNVQSLFNYYWEKHRDRYKTLCKDCTFASARKKRGRGTVSAPKGKILEEGDANCKHRYVYEKPNGLSSVGVCKYCDAKREDPNRMDWNWQSLKTTKLNYADQAPVNVVWR